MIFSRYAPFLAALCAVAIAWPVSEPAFGQASCPSVEELTRDLPADATEAMRHIRYLADDRLEGREVGSRAPGAPGNTLPENFAASDWLPPDRTTTSSTIFRSGKASASVPATHCA